jgi:hypothetical protein
MVFIKPQSLLFKIQVFKHVFIHIEGIYIYIKNNGEGDYVSKIPFKII